MTTLLPAPRFRFLAQLNEWIRTSHAFDGVIDFDKALRDPSDPTKLLSAFAGDPLHPNDAG